MHNVFIAGGAGFIGSHFAVHLLSLTNVAQVTIYDNFSSGEMAHLSAVFSNPRLMIINADIKNSDALINAMRGHDTVIHLASNPDIARAVIEPSIDFKEGTFLTECIVEAMRINNCKRILYASGSGVYGEVGSLEVSENYGPLNPISTYGASKLAGEALICSYAHMFGLTGIAFRFANVVGPHQTHGVGYDFIRKLKKNNKQLTILGDGNQSKSYLYISDVINAVLLANAKCNMPFELFNVATNDYIIVSEIAKIAIQEVIGNDEKVALLFSGGDRGWKGDIPIVRLNSNKIRALGWKNHYTSFDAIRKSIQDMSYNEVI